MGNIKKVAINGLGRIGRASLKSLWLETRDCSPEFSGSRSRWG